MTFTECQNEEEYIVFKNIGGKIKVLASVVAWLGIIGSVIGGISYMTIDEDFVFLGIIIAVVGSVGSWISSFVLYGFGELVENSAIIAQKQDVTISKSKGVNTPVQQAQTNVDSLKKSNGKCQLCGAENVEVMAAVIVDDFGTRHRSVCESCFKKNNCKPE